jgi:hypothetical protein
MRLAVRRTRVSCDLLSRPSQANRVVERGANTAGERATVGGLDEPTTVEGPQMTGCERPVEPVHCGTW